MTIKVGSTIVFTGYADDVPEDERVLEVDEKYEVASLSDEEEGVVFVEIENPDFDSDEDEDEDDNPKILSINVFPEEYTEDAPKAKAKAGKPVTAAAKPAAKPVAKPVAKPTTKAKAKAEPEEEEEEAEEEVPAAKPAAKAKSKLAEKGGKAAKGKPAKGKAKKKAETEPEEEVERLESEDEDILELVQDAEDILELARELTEESAGIDYRLGGVLYHIRLDKAYQTLDEKYKEKGGFAVYVKEQLSIEYRKAMYLIDIYVKFNKAGIPGSKVAEIGWAKAAKIAAVMTPDNAEELVELAENNTVVDLVENIKETYKEVGGTKGEKKKTTLFKFRLYEEQAASVAEILKAAAAALNFKRLDEAFEHIVTEWGAEHPLSAPAAGKKVSAKAGSKRQAEAESEEKPSARAKARARA